MRTPMLLWIIRGVFLIIILGLATGLALQVAQQMQDTQKSQHPADATAWNELAPYGAFFGLLIVGIGMIVLDLFMKHKEITTLSAVYFGLLLGLLFGQLFTNAIWPLIEPPSGSQWVIVPVRILITSLFCY